MSWLIDRHGKAHRPGEPLSPRRPRGSGAAEVTVTRRLDPAAPGPVFVAMLLDPGPGPAPACSCADPSVFGHGCGR